MDPNAPTDEHTPSAAALLDRLEQAGQAPDPDLLRACLARPAELTPTLLEWLARPDDPDWPEEDPRFMAKIHAGLLLIAYREPAALPVFAQLYRTGDMLSEGFDEWFDTAIPNYGPAALPALIDLLGDPQVPEVNQCSLIEILTTVAVRHPQTRAAVVERLRSLLPRLDPDTGAPQIGQEQGDELPGVWIWAVQGLADLRDLPSSGQIRALFEHELLDPWLIDEQEYLRHLNRPHSSTSFLLAPTQPFDLQEHYEAFHDGLADEAFYDELTDEDEQAAREAEEAQRDLKQSRGRVKLLSAEEAARRAAAAQPQPSQTPIVRATPKVGRNEPCPCGSGRKYKHCHGK